MPQFIQDMQTDRAARNVIIEKLSSHMLFADDAPWQVIDMTLDDLDAFI
jgi:hypothetical protein